MARLMMAALAGAVLMTPLDASANTLTIVPNDVLVNLTSVVITGSGNVLQIVQTHGTSEAAANSVTIAIDGDLNGAGRLPSSVDPRGLNLESADASGGLIVQSGDANMVSFSVTGTNNLFSLVQSGSGNSITGAMNGIGNMAGVHQIGQGNISAFSQNGNGNIVSISQTSW